MCSYPLRTILPSLLVLPVVALTFAPIAYAQADCEAEPEHPECAIPMEEAPVPEPEQAVEPEPPAVQPAPAPAAPPPVSARPVYYPNCTAVWNAIGRPVYRGEPGYAPHLDRDGDGIGCETRPR